MQYRAADRAAGARILLLTNRIIHRTRGSARARPPDI